jgi:IS1 family transposase
MGHPEDLLYCKALHLKKQGGLTMNVTPKEKQIQVLKMLVEGNSIRSIERMTDIHRDTIMRLLVRVGQKCQNIMDEKIRNFHSDQIQVDEIWTFVKKKEVRIRKHERSKEIGDQFVFVAIDPETKLVPCFVVGKRTSETALEFSLILKKKLEGNGRIQLTSDGFRPYITAIETAFGSDIDYAQLIKTFASAYIEPGRYAPPHPGDDIRDNTR